MKPMHNSSLGDQKTNSRGARHVPKQPRLHAETWTHAVSRETTSEKKKTPPGKEEGGLGKRKKPSDLTLKRKKAGLKALRACVYARESCEPKQVGESKQGEFGFGYSLQTQCFLENSKKRKTRLAFDLVFYFVFWV